jgi:hypothetical protein
MTTNDYSILLGAIRWYLNHAGRDSPKVFFAQTQAHIAWGPGGLEIS